MRNVAWLGGDLLALAGDESAGWRRVAARGLLGLDDSAVEALGEVPDEDAAFYRACLAWMNRDERTAITLLQALPDLKEAGALLELIQRPRIDVLGFLPEDGEEPYGLVDTPLFDPKFRLRNVGYARGSLPNPPDADIHHLIGPIRPDFIVVEMIEWPALPRNLRDAACPVLGHSNDFDFAIQSVLPMLKQFDVIMTIEPVAPSGLDRLVGAGRIVTYPAVWSAAVPSSPSQCNRPVDFVMTSTVLHDSNRDKEAVLRHVLGIPGLDYFLHNGPIQKRRYAALLGCSKLTLDFVRRPAMMSTRAIQALAAGCCCLVPSESLNHLYIPPDHGLIKTNFAYPADIIRNVVDVTQREPERYQIAAQRGAAHVWRHFSKERIGSRYFRFATIMASFVTAGRMARLDTPQPYYVKRGEAWRGACVPNAGKPETIDRLRESALSLIESADGPAFRRANDQGRILACDYFLYAHQARHRPNGHLNEDAIHHFRHACELAPKALVPHFNFIRCAFHFGTERAKTDAEDKCRAIIAANPADWEIDFADDLMPYDFFPAFCNTRRLVDLLILEAAAPGSQRDALVDTILASVYFYLAWRLEQTELLRQSVRLDPSFVNARFELARSLVTDGDGTAALPIIETLSSTYLLSAELVTLRDRAATLAAAPAALPPSPVFSDRLIDMAYDYFADFPAVAQGRRRRFAETEMEIWRRPPKPVAVSLIILDQHLRWCTETAALDGMMNPNRNSAEIIYTDIYARLDEAALEWADLVMRPMDIMPIIEHRGRVLMNAFAEARGDILCFAERLDGTIPAWCLSYDAEPTMLPDHSIAVDLDRRDATAPRVTAAAMHRRDFIELGGFDLSVASQGPRGGIHELIWRAKNAGFTLLVQASGALVPLDPSHELPLLSPTLSYVGTRIDLLIHDRWTDETRTKPIWGDSTRLQSLGGSSK